MPSKAQEGAAVAGLPALWIIGNSVASDEHQDSGDEKLAHLLLALLHTWRCARRILLLCAIKIRTVTKGSSPWLTERITHRKTFHFERGLAEVDVVVVVDLAAHDPD